MLYLFYLFIVLLFLGFLIGIHEFGHFITAKLFHVKVNQFFIGMGPTVFARKKGETEYGLKLLPVGGFCSMEGEDEDTHDPRCFYVQTGWKKFLVLFMGPFMNFLAGFFLLVIVVSQSEAMVLPKLESLFDGFPYASEQGLLPGDEFVSIGGEAVWMQQDVGFLLDRAAGAPVDITVKRDGSFVTIPGLMLERRDYVDSETGDVLSGYYGFRFTRYEDITVFDVLAAAGGRVMSFGRQVLFGLSDMAAGNVKFKDMSGVVGVVDTVSEVGAESESVSAGFSNIMMLMSLITINLGIMNLLPIPALDGGRILFVLLNGVAMLFFKERIPAKTEAYFHGFGMLVLMLFMLAVTLKDVIQVFSAMYGL